MIITEIVYIYDNESFYHCFEVNDSRCGDKDVDER